MKTKKNMGILVICFLSSIMLIGCNLLPKVSISDRISSFAAHLSGTRSAINSDFEVTSSGYASADTYFPAISFPIGSYSIDGINQSNPAAVTATLHFPSGAISSSTITFNMTQTLDGDYVIHSLSNSNPSITIPY